MYGVKVARLPGELDSGIVPPARGEGDGIAEGELPDLDDSAR